MWDCDVQADRWVITVEREGQRRQFVSFRNPFGQTRGERLGAKFALHEPVKVKKLHPLLAGRHGKVIGYGAKVDTYQVAVGPRLAVSLIKESSDKADPSAQARINKGLTNAQAFQILGGGVLRDPVGYLISRNILKQCGIPLNQMQLNAPTEAQKERAGLSR